jgi:hypothetical protein
MSACVECVCVCGDWHRARADGGLGLRNEGASSWVSYVCSLRKAWGKTLPAWVGQTQKVSILKAIARVRQAKIILSSAECDVTMQNLARIWAGIDIEGGCAASDARIAMWKRDCAESVLAPACITADIT